jgi:hypothetical protein
MQKVKFFEIEVGERNKFHSRMEGLEKQINAWLVKNTDIKVLVRETSVTAAPASLGKEKTDLQPDIFIVITVWYEIQGNAEARE